MNDELRLYLQLTIVVVGLLCLVFLYLVMDKAYPAAQIEKNCNKAWSEKLQNYTCTKKELGCYYGGFYYADCSGLGRNSFNVS